MMIIKSSSETKYLRWHDRFGDVLLGTLTRLAASLVSILLAGIVITLFFYAWPSIQAFGLNFLWEREWDINAQQFGAWIPIYGTLTTSFIALLIAIPISFGIAFFLSELAPQWLRQPLGIAIELLAAIPSIVFGMWGLLVFAPIFSTYFQKPATYLLGDIPIIGALFQGVPLGIGLLSAGIILAIMIIPYITAVMRDVFRLTPVWLKESAYGIGCTTWEVLWKIVVPYTQRGIIGAIMLGLGRALGETMAVTFVIGNVYSLSSPSLFAMGNSITSTLANEFAEALPGLHTAALLELGLILFLITFIVLVLSKLLLFYFAKNGGQSI